VIAAVSVIRVPGGGPAAGPDTRSATITWSNIADIVFQRGDTDEALRIRHDIQLPVYERLGDTRETAITWDKIANILFSAATTTKRPTSNRRRWKPPSNWATSTASPRQAGAWPRSTSPGETTRPPSPG